MRVGDLIGVREGGCANGFVGMGGRRVLQLFFFLDPWFFDHTKLGRCVRTGNTFTAVRHCCTAVAHGGRVDRLADVFMGSWVRGCVGWYVVDGVPS